MAIRIRIPYKKAKATAARASDKWFRSTLGRHAGDPIIRVAVATFIIISTIMFGVFAFYYVKYDRIIERRIKGPLFASSASIYARPQVIHPGNQVSLPEIARHLRRSGYVELTAARNQSDGASGMGSFRLLSSAIEIHPGTLSYHSTDAAVIRFSGNTVDSIAGLGPNTGQSLNGYELEPEMLTQLFEGEQRTKRQLVKFSDLPKDLVNSVISIEDRRFFQHNGVNYWRLAQAALVDLRAGGRGKQGGSTITMQLSRGFFLTPEKRLKRKLTEILIAIELEQKLSKQQIFEMYANQVDLGQRGSYTISGFGEGARAYFAKDVKDLTLPEAALLAGLIQRPSYLSPYRHPDRATERRNLVLEAMVDTGSITREQADHAKATPLKLAPMNVESSDAPYFVDMVKDAVQSTLGDHDLNEQAYRIYTTIDAPLQRAAAEAVSVGIKLVDEQVKRQRIKRVKVGEGKAAHYETREVPGPVPQVALVALDPRTGEVLALVGGRNYGFSQLNHAVAKRPTGSIFKPFVYAAAVNTAVSGSDKPFTPATLIDDSPTTFAYGDQIYEPRNYKNEYHGQVTARYALQQSLNNATVRLAEMVGYDKVADLARSAGIASAKATPAVALGAYDASPMEMAGAYTVFANAGVRISPLAIRSVRTRSGDMVQDFSSDSRPVLDPRVAYVMTTMMQGVINNGTGFAVRARGFTAPAAGKTGTSHDAWFAGYTTNLLCIVWVGYDDYSDLRLSGAATAAPIWAEFMKQAVKLPQYQDAHEFPEPSGVVNVRLDKATNLLSTGTCPDAYSVAFVAGTEPKMTCDQSENRNILQRIFGTGGSNPPPPVNGPPRIAPPGNRTQQPPSPVPQPPARTEQDKKKGFFGRVFGVFKSEDKDTTAEESGQNPPSR